MRNQHKILALVIVLSGIFGLRLLSQSDAATEQNSSTLAGDINSDGAVNIFDLSLLLSQWGQTSEPQNPTPVGQANESWSLVFQDEFTDDRLDESVWGYQRGTWGASEVQNCYVDQNSQVQNGSLQIISRYEPGYQCFSNTRDFTSGFIQTKDRIAWTYGYFEARMKLPESGSTWPAFWLSPEESVYGSWPRSGEIDILEAKGYDTTRTYADAHWGESSTNKRNWTQSYDVGDFTQWHTYGLEWNEGELKYYIDGNLYHTIDDFRDPNATTHPGPFDQDFYIRLNMAVGGTYLSSPYNDARNSINDLPATMEVDYVRVWQK